MTTVPRIPFRYWSTYGVEVSSWPVEPSSSPNPDPNRQADDFFTFHIYYHDTYTSNAIDRSASFMLERTSLLFDRFKTQVDFIEWLDEVLDVKEDAYGCAADVVVDSCEILLHEISEGRKSLAMIVEIKVGPEYGDDMEGMFMDIHPEEESNETYEEKLTRTKEVETFLRTKKIIRPCKVDMDYHCSICLEEFDKSCSEQEVADLCCSHIFHGSCLVSWILVGKNSCPLCRCNFMPCDLNIDGN